MQIDDYDVQSSHPAGKLQKFLKFVMSESTKSVLEPSSFNTDERNRLDLDWK